MDQSDPAQRSCFTSRGGDETPHFFLVFNPRLAFDPAGHVHPERSHASYRVGHVFGREATGEKHPPT
jgi:hypothetical protein